MDEESLLTEEPEKELHTIEANSDSETPVEEQKEEIYVKP